MSAIELKNAMAGDLRGWRGLSEAETLESVADALEPLKKVHTAVDSERQYKRFRLVVFERESPPPSVEAWILHGQDYVTLVEYQDPPIEDAEGLLEAYGPPETILRDARFIGEREYVYARRGITFEVEEPYPNPEPQPRRIVRVQLYRAASVNYYLDDIGAGMRVQPSTRHWQE